MSKRSRRCGAVLAAAQCIPQPLRRLQSVCPEPRNLQMRHRLLQFDNAVNAQAQVAGHAAHVFTVWGLRCLRSAHGAWKFALRQLTFLVEATNTTRATFYLRSNVTQVAVAPAPDSSRTSQKTDGDKRERLRLLPQRVLSPTSRALDFSWCTNTPASHAVLSKARVCAGAAEGWGPHLSTRFLTHRRTRRFRSHSM